MPHLFHKVNYILGFLLEAEQVQFKDKWNSELVKKYHNLVGFPGGSDGKESAYNVGDIVSVPGLERSPGEGSGYPLQCSYLEKPMDRGVWWAIVPMGLQRFWTWLSDWHMHTSQFNIL